MVTFTEKRFPPLQIGDEVTLAIPLVDRGPLDFQNISGVVINFANDVYQIGTLHGVLKGWFPRTDLAKSSTNAIKVNDVPREVFLSLREDSGRPTVINWRARV